MKRRFTLLIAGAPVALALVVAGCGSSGSGLQAGANAAKDAAQAAKVSGARSSLGRLVVDGNGRTLYLFEKDSDGRSTCYGACASYWPPLLSHGKPLAHAGARQALLGTTRRSNGTVQVTYAGHPVYRFAGDTRPGQTTGEGLQDFGAGWDAITPAGKNIEADG
jgi:predicted lipoprotein with Yx(FWY)xxD motif